MHNVSALAVDSFIKHTCKEQECRVVQSGSGGVHEVNRRVRLSYNLLSTAHLVQEEIKEDTHCYTGKSS